MKNVILSISLEGKSCGPRYSSREMHMTQVDFVSESKFISCPRGLFWTRNEKHGAVAQQEIRPCHRGFAPAPNPEFQFPMAGTDFLIRLLGGFLGALGTQGRRAPVAIGQSILLDSYRWELGAPL